MWKTALFGLVFASFPLLDSCFPQRIFSFRQTNPVSKKIQVRGHNFVDHFGRVRIFHGWNSVLKGFPWYDHQILNETRLDLFKEWGLNSVRLGTMWSGAEPTEGKYNETYISILKKIVSELGKRGIYTIFDMHQDVISTKYHGYDGVPRWLINSFPPEKHPYPWPLPHPPSGPDWALGYLTEGVGHAFQCIYDDVQNARQKFGKFWQKIAQEFKDSDSVLGYELINEPWAGDIYEKPSLLVPGVAGKDNLQPLYEELNSAIRRVDQKTIVFYEPVTWGVFFGNGTYLGTGFTQVPGGKMYEDRSALSYHYYCWLLGPNATKPFPFFERKACTHLSESVFRNVVEDVKTLGGSLFLTEFGICAPNGSPKSIDTMECERIMQEADAALQSWTYWDSHFFYPNNGSIVDYTAKAFSRTYARATAGIPITMFFNYTTAEFKFKYIFDRNIKAPTEIFVSPLHYAKGKTVTVSKNVVWREDEVKHVVYVEPKKPESDSDALYYESRNEVVEVHIVAKSTADEQT